MSTSLVALEKMVMLVLLMLLGFFCARGGWIDSGFSQKASRLVMNVFIVGLIISAAIGSEPVLSNAQLAWAVVVVFLVFLLGGLLGWVAARLLGLKGQDRRVAYLSVFFMNNVFIGFPLVEAMFGPSAIFCASLSNIPFNLLLYSVGVAQLRAGEGRGRIQAREIITPPLIATAIAILIFVFRIPVPGLVEDTLSTLGAATVPMSMLIVGTSLSQVPVKEALSDKRAYGMSFVKLILCPVFTWLLLGLLLPPELELLKGVFVVISACPSAAMITILCVRFGLDDALASKINFLSTILSAVTLPLVTYFLL